MSKPTSLLKIHRSDNAKIYETDNFKDGCYFIKKHHDKKTRVLALFDLDNTILSYRHTLGTDQWFEFDFNQFIREGKNPDQAKKGTLGFYLNMVNKISAEDVYAVEEDTPEQIRQIQKMGVETLILTSRGDYLKDKTNEQLAQFELSFDMGRFKGKEKKLTQSPEGLFTQGMILTGGAHKGDCLFSMLQDTDHMPQIMIMWDDRLSNLQKVQEAITHYNNQKQLEATERHITFEPIKFIGIRYSKLDDIAQKLNPEVVALQKAYFDHILSDEDASAIIKAQKKKSKSHYVDIDFEPQKDEICVSICKASTYQLLTDIDPNIDKFRVLGNVKTFHDKPKLTWQFKLSQAQFEPLFHKLSQHGLIEPAQFDLLSQRYNQPTLLTPLFDNTRQQTREVPLTPKAPQSPSQVLHAHF
ncbi:MAG: DUF2608 domain-containing protein [Candidatus Berkiella sp.]